MIDKTPHYVHPCQTGLIWCHPEGDVQTYESIATRVSAAALGLLGAVGAFWVPTAAGCYFVLGISTTMVLTALVLKQTQHYTADYQEPPPLEVYPLPGKWAVQECPQEQQPLPPEILENVFRFLDSDDKIAARAVSRTWYHLGTDLDLQMRMEQGYTHTCTKRQLQGCAQQYKLVRAHDFKLAEQVEGVALFTHRGSHFMLNPVSRTWSRLAPAQVKTLRKERGAGKFSVTLEKEVINIWKDKELMVQSYPKPLGTKRAALADNHLIIQCEMGTMVVTFVGS